MTQFFMFLKRLLCNHEATTIIHVYYDGAEWKNPYRSEHDVHEHSKVPVKLRCLHCRKVLLRKEEVVRYKKTKKVLRIGLKMFKL